MRYLLFFLHGLLLIACYLVYLNKTIDASSFPYFQYLAIFLPALLFINLFFIVLWIIIKPWVAILFTVISIGLYPQYKSYFIWNSTEQEEEHGKIKLTTYNVRYFYGDMAKFKAWLDKEDPDILLTQEHNRVIFDKSTANNYPYYEEYNYVAISSKYPILETQAINLPHLKGRMCYADIKINEDTIRLVNIYLQSLKISENLNKTKRISNLTDRSKDLSYRMEKSYTVHKEQINAIKPYIIDSPYPVILGTDMNAVPHSYEYEEFKNLLNDAYADRGKGFGFTFSEFIFPLRLDYIFYSNGISLTDYLIDKSIRFSDHYPIHVEFSID